MTPIETPEHGEDVLSEVKDEILEVLNQLRKTSERLQMALEVPGEKIDSLLARGEALAQRISSLPGMGQAGEDFLVHLNKIGQAIKDLQRFDALKKENLVTGVKF
ncbi:MAG: hypothetical protein A2Y79_08925 [Deltaproteobacteria bacterium RBG_13_43_22]|nr:MAG: hypothetical protein A2Y79_08925 [Deltaproteobacteria bacterium RBG_13_43_22]